MNNDPISFRNSCNCYNCVYSYIKNSENPNIPYSLKPMLCSKHDCRVFESKVCDYYKPDHLKGDRKIDYSENLINKILNISTEEFQNIVNEIQESKFTINSFRFIGIYGNESVFEFTCEELEWPVKTSIKNDYFLDLE